MMADTGPKSAASVHWCYHWLLGLALLGSAAAVEAADAGTTSGTSQISISGGLDLTLGGQGLFLLRAGQEGDTFMLVLTAFASETDFTTVEILGHNGIPGPGSYAIGSDGFEGGWLHAAADATWIGAANSGELIIESATSDRLVGSLRFSGDLVRGNDYENVLACVVEASFEAEHVSLEDLPGAQ